MEEIKLSKKEIAEAFSNGNFLITFPYLSDEIIWNVIGEKVFEGKSEVVHNCKQTSEYFKSVQTNFTTEEIIETNSRVIIQGTGEFLRNGERVSFITACDVYEFNANGELAKISSYCIAET